MYDLNAFTPAQAADPSLPAELIAQLAAARPDLHAALLENPSMYPQLRQWIIDNHTYERTVDQYRELYAEIVKTYL